MPDAVSIQVVNDGEAIAEAVLPDNGLRWLRQVQWKTAAQRWAAASITSCTTGSRSVVNGTPQPRGLRNGHNTIKPTTLRKASANSWSSRRLSPGQSEIGTILPNEAIGSDSKRAARLSLSATTGAVPLQAEINAKPKSDRKQNSGWLGVQRPGPHSRLIAGLCSCRPNSREQAAMSSEESKEDSGSIRPQPWLQAITEPTIMIATL